MTPEFQQVYHIESSYPKPYKIHFLWCPCHFPSYRRRKSSPARPEKYGKREDDSVQSIPSSITPTSGSYCCLGPLPSFSLCPGQQTAKPANLRKALIKLLSHLSTLAPYTMENQKTKQPLFINYVREFVD